MSEPVNVVARWRERATSLARQAWACAACGRLSLARRRICAACGRPAEATRASLPRVGVVVATSQAGAAVEHLDQVTGRKPAVLIELPGGAHLACLLAQADSISLQPLLRGRPVRLSVRRIPLTVAPDEPIPYGLKASVNLETRRELKLPKE